MLLQDQKLRNEWGLFVNDKLFACLTMALFPYLVLDLTRLTFS